MELTGEHTIQADRQKVWESLNDPEILKQCIPGCEEIEQSDENEFSAKVKAKVGPVNSRFSGKVTLSNLNPPESYTISGEGSGGAAGFAKGGADVHLEEIDASQTKLSYKVDAQVGGKLAQLGQRLIQSTANKYAKQFFDKFEQIVGEGAAADAAADADAAAAEGTQSTPQGGAAAAGGEARESGVRRRPRRGAGRWHLPGDPRRERPDRPGRPAGPQRGVAEAGRQGRRHPGRQDDRSLPGLGRGADRGGDRARGDLRALDVQTGRTLEPGRARSGHLRTIPRRQLFSTGNGKRRARRPCA